ncbi:hypothetical protein [Thermus scotoductus]|uniref:hypothetical protein n=1 Tax=Thermus scotoductus TaxID=37636 RepID=UPI00057033CE|nr:hypothetical protein [Thermus scotoductus]
MESLGPVLRALEAGRDGEAEALLGARPPAGLEEAAEALALRGFLLGRRGDLLGYRRLALEAARMAPTPLTLYHLGLALPPGEGVVALEEALHRLRGDPEGEARLHLALARARELLGQGEALAHAALAHARWPSPWTHLHRLRLELFFGEMPLEEVLAGAEGYAFHPYPGVRLLAGFTLLLAHLLRGRRERAAAAMRGLLPSLGPGAYGSFLGEGVLALLGEPGLDLLLEGAKAALPQGKQGYLALGQGLALFEASPEEAYPHLEEALLSLGEGPGVDRPRALLAASRLAWLRGLPLPPELHGLALALRPEAQALYLGPLAAQEGEFRALGEPRLFGKPLPLRQAELLVLLLARPEGWRGEALARALYGEGNTPALRMELHRLRARGLAVGSRPYRLLSPLQADFLEVKEALARGDLPRALRFYRGPLLPRSQAPAIEEMRAHLEEALRQRVLASGNPLLLEGLAARLGDDLELWEALLERLAPEDPRRPGVLARVGRLRREYGL